MFKSKKLSKFKNINHYFFSRKGGYSTGLYKGLNCGRGSEDKKINVLKNLKYVSKKIKVKGNKLILRTRIIYETFINKTFHKSACLIEISDNGPGIPDDLIDSIFFPLVSTKEITSGLGLAIARGIINQHKGEIDCISDSKGTTFSVILPIEENSEFLKEELNA